MNVLASLLNQDVVNRAAWALLHFLWQGALLAVVGAVVARSLTSASARYLVGIATLTAMCAAPVATFVALWPAAEPALAATSAAERATSITMGDAAGVAQPEVSTRTGTAGATLSWVVAIWACGVVLLSVRLGGGWLVARRLVIRAVRPVTPDIERVAGHLADRLAVRCFVRIVESTSVSVPVMVGWLKPVVLVPAAALVGLGPAQLEALLAHELAHVRRHDYLVNLFQSAVETLLFYHPAVWWVSHRVRMEREHCCDDMTVGVCDRLIYASALTELAALTRTPALALAATDGSLLRRVRRILEGHGSAQNASGWLGGFAVLLCVSGIAVSALALGSVQEATHVQVGTVDGTSSYPLTTSPGLIPSETVLSDSPRAANHHGVIAVHQAPSTEVSLSAAWIEEQELHRLEMVRSALEESRWWLSEEREPSASARSAALEAALTALRLRQQSNHPGRQDADALREELVALERQIARERQQIDSLREKVAPLDLEEALAVLLKDADFMRARGLLKGDTQYETLLRNIEGVLWVQQRQREQVLAAAQRGRQDADALRQALEALERQIVEERQREREQVLVVGQPELDAQLARQRERVSALEEIREQRLLAQESGRLVPGPDIVVVSDSRATVQPGDILEIRIQGEVTLPTIYEVAANSEIRFPLLGAIQVAGRTVVEIQQQMTTLLTERRLGATKQVTVVLRRR